MSHGSFITTALNSDKDFDAEFIREYIVSRVNLCDYPALIEALFEGTGGCDPNGAKFAIFQMEKLA